MKYLIVAAHPDDEALGAGAAIHNLAKKGNEVFVCLLSHWSPTRDDNLKEGIEKSHAILGVKEAVVGDFGCMRFKDEDHHAIVRFIESAIRKFEPEMVITHHPADVHIDHGVVAECTLEAIKLPQRQIDPVSPIFGVFFMEVPSSTDWNINPTGRQFAANSFISVNHEDLHAKFDAICVYKDVIRKAPHPRCRENIEALARIRGAQSGCLLAEAFQQVFRLGL